MFLLLRRSLEFLDENMLQVGRMSGDLMVKHNIFYSVCRIFWWLLSIVKEPIVNTKISKLLN